MLGFTKIRFAFYEGFLEGEQVIPTPFLHKRVSENWSAHSGPELKTFREAFDLLAVSNDHAEKK